MSIDLFAVAGVILVFILLAILFLMPTEKTPRRMKKSRLKTGEEEDRKDWRTAALRMEKHIKELRQEIADGKRRERKYEQSVLVEKEKVKRVQDKLTQERSWQDKGKDDQEKFRTELAEIKKNFRDTEEALQEEHGKRLQLERDIRELKEDLIARSDELRLAQAKGAKTQAQSDVYRKEIMELREQNAKLSKQKSDTTFVAKSDYKDLEYKLKNAEKELHQLKELVKRRGL